MRRQGQRQRAGRWQKLMSRSKNQFTPSRRLCQGLHSGFPRVGSWVAKQTKSPACRCCSVLFKAQSVPATMVLCSKARQGKAQRQRIADRPTWTHWCRYLYSIPVLVSPLSLPFPSRTRLWTAAAGLLWTRTPHTLNRRAGEGCLVCSHRAFLRSSVMIFHVSTCTSVTKWCSEAPPCPCGPTWARK